MRSILLFAFLTAQLVLAERDADGFQRDDQVPIVVSSSDNSYVSASPSEEEETTTTTFSSSAQNPQSTRSPSSSLLWQSHHHYGTANSNNNNNDITSKTSHHLHQYTHNLHNQANRQTHRLRYKAHKNSPLMLTETVTGHDISSDNSNDQQASLNDDHYRREYADDQASESLNNENNIKPKTRKSFNIEEHFVTKQASIIKTRESLENGATFINYTIVTNLNACLVECWITDTCDTAVYQESPVDFDSKRLPFTTATYGNQEQSSLSASIKYSISEVASKGLYRAGEDFPYEKVKGKRWPDERKRRKLPQIGFFICYLFECAKLDGFKCQFSAHNYYTSSTRRYIERTTTTVVPSTLKTSTLSSVSFEDSEIDLDDELEEVDVRKEKIAHSDTGSNNIIDFRRKFTTGEQHRSRAIITSCLVDNFKCAISNRCIPMQFKCDGIYQCSDWSDELACWADESSYRMINNSSASNFVVKLLEPPERTSDSIDERVLDSETRIRYNLIATVDPLSEADQVETEASASGEPKYAKIVNGHSNHHAFVGHRHWQDSRIASIRIQQEEGDDFGRGALNGAIIAIILGICATGMLIVIVGYKMKSIQKRVAYKVRRRSLVPDTEYLINSFPT